MSRMASVLLSLATVPWLVESAKGQCLYEGRGSLDTPYGAGLPSDGKGVAVSGDWMAVGAPGINDYAGAVYLFVREASAWSHHSTITASDGAEGDWFGGAVALDGPHLVVGRSANQHSDDTAGAAYFFMLQGSNWTELQKVTPSTASENDYFGSAVDLEGEVAVIGAPDAGPEPFGPGSVYFFRFSGTSWVEEQELGSSTPEFDGNYGGSVSLSGDRAAIGAYRPLHGSVDIVAFDGSQWVVEQVLTAAEQQTRDYFGWSVALRDDRLLVGAIGADDTHESQGAAYLFEDNGNTWQRKKRFVSTTPFSLSSFGDSLALGEDIAFIGNRSDGGGAGAAFFLRRIGSQWKILERIGPSDGGQSLGQFADSVAIDGDTLVASSTMGTTFLVEPTSFCLDATPETPAAGQTLTFTTDIGLSSSAALLYLVDINNIPLFERLFLGQFDAQGMWSVDITVPPGLWFLTMQFQTLGRKPDGKLAFSNAVEVRF